jgi:uncharacterized protein YprB with RNaseH-like and TPR domain
MNFEDKLKRLKIERASRSRSDTINKTWQQIDKNADLTTKEKLERLISLTRNEKTAGKKKDRPEPKPRPPVQVFENQYLLQTRYGKTTLSPGLKVNSDVLRALSRDQEFSDRDLSTALFLDLETTGLSGGTGVVPFLVGLGFYREDRFHVRQFFLGDLAAEERMIRDLGRFFTEMDFRSVVTFNGKGFDLPLLETRFILCRQNLPISGLPHLDFLFPARSLWGHQQESCRLFHLAREILGADREEDIPSAEIPVRYFEYLRTGDFSLMEPVLYHNQEDILSLLGVVIIGSGFLSEKPEDEVDFAAGAMDLFGAAKILEKTGDLQKSALFIRRALEGPLSEDVALLAKKKLATHFKKTQDWEKAIRLWQEMTLRDQLSSFRELAMYYEHKAKDYQKAKALAEEGLALAMQLSRTYESDFSHRLERLKTKIARPKKDGAGQ